MNDRYEMRRTQLADAVLSSPGNTETELRRAVETWVAGTAGRVEGDDLALPPDLLPYLTKLAYAAHEIVDEDVASLMRAGYSEDAVFEITLSAALGAGMARLDRGMAAIKEDR